MVVWALSCLNGIDSSENLSSIAPDGFLALDGGGVGIFGAVFVIGKIAGVKVVDQVFVVDVFVFCGLRLSRRTGAGSAPELARV